VPSIDAIVGIPHRSATKLRRARVRTTEALLKRAARPDERGQLSAATGIADDDLVAWCHRAELLSLTGVGAEYAHVLAELGVGTLAALAGRDGDGLWEEIVATNEKKRYVKRLPTDEMVAVWVAEAQRTPSVVH
jgi:hypothetical protein